MKKHVLINRTGSRGHHDGSVTVEASLAFPIYFFCTMLFFQLFLLVLTEMSVARDVCNLSSDMAPVSYTERALLKEKVTAPSLGFYPELLIKMSEKTGVRDVRVLCLDDTDFDVNVQVHYTFRMAVPGLPAMNVKVKQSFRIHPYVGEYDPDKLIKEQPEEQAPGDVVYITENGQVYHLKKSCTYLTMIVTDVRFDDVGSKRNSSGHKYYPCERCDHNRNTGTVYITSYGTKYHLVADCPALFRNIKEVSKSEVSDRRPCSKCGKQEEK